MYRYTDKRSEEDEEDLTWHWGVAVNELVAVKKKREKEGEVFPRGQMEVCQKGGRD